MSKKKLCKSLDSRLLFGVCGGLAEYFGVDPTLFRIIVILLSIFSSFGTVVAIYFIVALIMPQGELHPEDDDYSNAKNCNNENNNDNVKKEPISDNDYNKKYRSDEDFNNNF